MNRPAGRSVSRDTWPVTQSDGKKMNSALCDHQSDASPSLAKRSVDRFNRRHCEASSCFYQAVMMLVMISRPISLVPVTGLFALTIMPRCHYAPSNLPNATLNWMHRWTRNEWHKTKLCWPIGLDRGFVSNWMYWLNLDGCWPNEIISLSLLLPIVLLSCVKLENWNSNKQFDRCAS